MDRRELLVGAATAAAVVVVSLVAVASPLTGLVTCLVFLLLVFGVTRGASVVDAGVLMCAVGFAGWAFTSDSTLAEASVTSGGQVSASPIKLVPVALMAAGAALVLIHAGPRHRIGRLYGARVTTLALAMYCLLVVATAFTAYTPDLSLLRAAQMVVPVVAAFALSWWRPGVALVMAIVACVVHAVLGTLMPQSVNAGYGLERVTGFLQVNTFAFAGAVTVVAGVALFAYYRHRIIGLGLVVAGLAAVFVAQSRTALVAGVLALIVCLFVGRRDGGRSPLLLRLGILMVGLPVLITIWFSESSAISTYFARGNSGDVSTLTGRTRLWDYLLRLAWERPLTGYGPGSLRAGPVSEQVISSVGYGGQAHNALIGAYVDSGLVGAVAWLVMMLGTGLVIWRSRSGLRPLCASLWVLLAVSSITEAGPQGFGLFWAVLLGVVVAGCARSGRGRVGDEPERGELGEQVAQSRVGAA